MFAVFFKLCMVMMRSVEALSCDKYKLYIPTGNADYMSYILCVHCVNLDLP